MKINLDSTDPDGLRVYWDRRTDVSTREPEDLVNYEVAAEWAKDILAAAAQNGAVDVEVGMTNSSYGAGYRFCTYQQFLAWLACSQSEPSEDDIIDSWINQTRIKTVKWRSYTTTLTHSYGTQPSTPMMAEFGIMRAMLAAHNRVNYTLCPNQPFLGRNTLETDCECAICPSCDRHEIEPENYPSCSNCERCTSCCSCSVCTSCDERVSDLQCSNCERCESCGCSCDVCSNCENDRSCDDCSQCDDCCECDNSRKLKRVTRDLYKYEVRGKQKVNTLTRLLGAEIEISKGYQCHPVEVAVAKWRASVVNDGSLPTSGSEVVTQPAGGDTWVSMIADLTGALTSTHCRAEVNDQCGLHIHVDAGDLTVWDVKRFVKLYAHVEQAVFDLTKVNITRCQRYAKPCGKTFTSMLADCSGKELKQQFLTKHYNVNRPDSVRVVGPNGEYRYSSHKSAIDKHVNTQIREMSTHKYNDTRYRAVNLHSYFYRGTIEFRHHHGTIHTEDITNWGIVVGSLVDYASRNTDEAVTKLCVQGRSRKKVLELVVGQKRVIDWMRNRWSALTSVDIGLIASR